MHDSRTKKAKRNIIYEFINYFCNILLSFITRTIIIYYLGKHYLGLNSLFASILQVLSLAELGFGNAVVFSMYKPLKEKDTSKINALLNLYKKIYKYIGIIILLSGLSLMPLIKMLIKDDILIKDNIYFIYLIYLLNTTVSYFLFSYKECLFIANQRNDILSKINTGINILKSILQIICILVLRNYYVYCLLIIISTLLNNIIVSIYAKKYYPNYYCDGEVTYFEKKNIKNNVIGLFLSKFGYVCKNSFDSIVLSKFSGLDILGCFNNYFYIITVLTNSIKIIINSIISGIGNKMLLSNKIQMYNDFNKYQLLFMWLCSWITVSLFCLFQPFMMLWVGKELMFNEVIMILFCIYFFTKSINLIAYAYKNASGLWYQDRYRTILEAISNLVLNVILVKKYGVYGVLLSTIITLIPFDTIWGSYILYKNYFNKTFYCKYIKKICFYSIVVVIASIITKAICLSLVINNQYINFTLNIIVCIVVPNVIFNLIYKLLPEYNDSIIFAKKIIQKNKISR